MTLEHDDLMTTLSEKSGQRHPRGAIADDRNVVFVHWTFH